MRARDIGVSVVAVVAAFLALQGTPDVDIQLRWMTRAHQRPGGRTAFPVPLTLVTDLDGDGRNEVVVLADSGTTVRVLSVPMASGETLVDPWVVFEAKLAPRSRVPGERRAVAMSAGYLDPRPTDGSARRQHLVVVREDWVVLCFDHALQRVWKMPLEHEGSLGEGSSYIIDQVAVTVTHWEAKVDERGITKGDASGGLVVVGGSMRHRDVHHYHSRAVHNRAGGGSLDGADPLGVHVEAFVKGDEDNRDEEEEAGMSEEERQRRAAEHFSLFALDAKASGKIRWQHVARVDRQKIAHPEARAVQRPQYKLEELEDLSGAEDETESFLGSGSHSGSSSSGRRYHQSLLHRLPHAWSTPEDTRLEVAMLRRRGSGGSCGSVSVEGGDEGAEASREGFRGLYDDGSASGRGVGGKKTTADAEGGGGGGGGGLARVVVARTRDGLEAVDLSNGRPLSEVLLPAAASGAGVYADVNWDGVVDHVQAVGTRGGEGWGHLHSGVAMGHLSEQASPSQAEAARQLPPCYALAVSGLPPREQLFNGSICHNAGALLDIQERLAKKKNSRSSTPRSLDVEVSVASPAIVPRERPGTTSARSSRKTGTSDARRGARSDVVFAVSSGVVSSYDDEGRLNWQDRRGPTWLREGSDGEKTNGYVLPFSLEVRSPGSGKDNGAPPLSEQRVLVVGQDKMCVYDRVGRVVGSTVLAEGPSQRPVIGDFDGDGIADVLIVGRSGTTAGYALAPDPGIRALFVAVLVVIGTMLVVAASYFPPPVNARASGFSNRGGSRAVTGGWEGRVGGAGGGGQPRLGVKSKRATD